MPPTRRIAFHPTRLQTSSSSTLYQRARSASAMSLDSFFPRAGDSLSNVDGRLALAALQEPDIRLMDAVLFAELS